MMSEWIITYRGEVAALLSALLWAIAAVLYQQVGDRIPPLQLTLLKGVIAIALILLTLLLRGTGLPEMPGRSLLLLAASGGLGISLGDTAFFYALNRLGSRRTLLLQTLSPAMTALIAAVVLAELLTPRSGIGMMLILLGVASVIQERVSPSAATPKAQFPWQGLAWALLAAAAQAGGAVLSRAALAETDVSPLVAALIRLVAGLVFLPLWMAAMPRSITFTWTPIASGRTWAMIGVAAFLGTYLAIWLQQTSLKFALAGVSQTLSAMSPIFVLPLAAWTGDRLTLRAILGAVVAVSGVALLFS